MDCSRTSVRQGASEVTLVYRRDMKDMPASNEVHEAIEEGVTAIFQAGPIRVVTDDKGNVTGVEFIRMAARRARRVRPAPPGTGARHGVHDPLRPRPAGHRPGPGPDLDRTGLRGRRGHQAAAGSRPTRSRSRPAGPASSGPATCGSARRPSSRPSPRAGAPPTRSTPSSRGMDLAGDPDPPDARRAAARVPLDRAVHERGQGAALPDDGPRGRGAQPRATSSTSCRTRARRRSPSRPAASSAPARRSASATCAASASSTARRSRRSSRSTTRAPATGASPRTASPAPTTTTSATTPTRSSCASRRAASTAAGAPRSARRSSARPATTSCGSASTRS